MISYYICSIISVVFMSMHNHVSILIHVYAHRYICLYIPVHVHVQKYTLHPHVLFVHIFCMCVVQVHDYYISMRLTNIKLLVTSLYRLCLVCTMLRRVKVKGRGTAHNYPRIQLSYLLILEHWRVNNYVALKMIRSNSAIVNEELGEASFSLLGNVMLGDNLKSKFDHICHGCIPSYPFIGISEMS